MKNIFESLPPIDVLKAYAEKTMAYGSFFYGLWILNYNKWTAQRKLSDADKPVAPMPQPKEIVIAIEPPGAPTRLPELSLEAANVSNELAARIAALEARKEERRNLESKVLEERERWDYEEQIRRLKKELSEKTEDSDRNARETVRLRFEIENLKELVEMKDMKIARLNARLRDSNRPKPYEKRESPVDSEESGSK